MQAWYELTVLSVMVQGAQVAYDQHLQTAVFIRRSSLSYLGLGAPPPNASWGRLLQEAQASVYTAPFGAIAPGLALVSLVIGLNLFADGLREVVDPTRRRSR